jgi:phosphoserine phosphatase
MTGRLLPSWRDGATRNAILAFLDSTDDIPPVERLAVYDNDGTLWCEKPQYTQLEFCVWQLQRSVAERPELADVAEFAAILNRDRAAMGAIGLPQIALALVGLFEGIEPEVFERRALAFFDETRHPDHEMPFDRMIYQPMLELMSELEDRGFTNCLVTGGGTEFVRAISERVYGVPQERVVGTLVTYDVRRDDGRMVLHRTRELRGEANEAAAKVDHIQVALGRRPSVAAGNSPGDAEMLEYTSTRGGPSLPLLVNHDDADREYAYTSEAGTFDADEAVTDTAARLGWTQISMRDDWDTIFPAS